MLKYEVDCNLSQSDPAQRKYKTIQGAVNAAKKVIQNDDGAKIEINIMGDGRVYDERVLIKKIHPDYKKKGFLRLIGRSQSLIAKNRPTITTQKGVGLVVDHSYNIIFQDIDIKDCKSAGRKEKGAICIKRGSQGSQFRNIDIYGCDGYALRVINTNDIQLGNISIIWTIGGSTMKLENNQSLGMVFCTIGPFGS